MDFNAIGQQILSAEGGHFGSLTGEEFDLLRKAIGSGYDVGGVTQTGGAAWRLEFLENTLAIMTEQFRHITFYNDLPKPRARSTAIEYARRTSVGDRNGGFYRAGELPLNHDATYDRLVGLVKYLGDVREIEMPFLLVDTLVEKRAETTEAGTLWILGQLERALFKGNAKLGVAGAEFEEIDGLETYISRDASPNNTINLWGQPLEEQHIRNGGQVIVDARGFADRIYAPSAVLEDYAAAYQRQTVYYRDGGGKENGLVVGGRIARIETGAGTYLPRTLYMYNGLTRETPPSSAPSLAPAPNPTVAISGLIASGAGQWGNSLGLTSAGSGSSGLVEYKVSYGNRYGESVPVASSPVSQTILYAQRTNDVRLTITNPGGFVQAPTHVVIYRRDTNADGVVSPWGCIARVALASVAGGATQTYDDHGSRMPGTYCAWMGEMNQNTIHLSQLLPYTRIALPSLSLSERFALVMFVSFILRIPNRWVEFQNIGRRTA